MSFGIVFGFIDNFFWIGLTSFEKYIPGDISMNCPKNTYSNFLGATLGTSTSIILKHISQLQIFHMG